MESFKAAAQYDDWEGTAAADDQPRSLHDYLTEKDLMKPGEFLLAATLYVGEHMYDKPYVKAFIFENDENFDTVKKALDAIEGPIPVRQVTVNLKVKEFLSFFKRFDLMLTRRGLDLEGREYSASE